MDQLPVELLCEILLKCSFEDLRSASKINKNTYNIYNDPRFWIEKGMRDFGVSKEIMISNNPYLQYQILIINSIIICDDPCDDPHDNPCDIFFKAGFSGNLDIINHYVNFFDGLYNEPMSSIIRGAAFAGHKYIAINIINKLTSHYDYKYSVMEGIEYAIKGGNIDLVIYLIPLLDNIMYWFIETCIIKAIEYHQLDIVKYLTGNKDVPLLEAFNKKMTCIYDEYGHINFKLNFFLTTAIEVNDFEMVVYIVDDLIKPNIKYEYSVIENIIDKSIKWGTPQITNYLRELTR